MRRVIRGVRARTASFAAQALRRMMAEGWKPRHLRLVAGAFGRFAGGRFEVLPIASASAVEPLSTAEILGSSAGFSKGPRFIDPDNSGREEADVDAPFPPLRFRRYAGARIDGHSAGIVVDGKHVVDDWTFGLLPQARLKGDTVVAHDATSVIHRVGRETSHIQQGVRVAGYHSHNWYHWMAEILPVVSLLDGAPEPIRSMPLLVPSHLARASSFRDALLALSGQREIIALPADSAAHVRDLVVVDTPVRCLPGFGVSTRPSTAFDFWHREAMVGYRRRLREALGVEDGIEEGLYLLVDRTHDPERTYNRDDVLSVAAEHGFTPVVGGDMSLVEQARLFARAEIVIGANGAGWTNLLFSSPGARALIWTVRGGEGGAWFRNLGAISGVEVRHLVVENASPEAFNGNPLKADYHLPLDALRASLTALVSA